MPDLRRLFAYDGWANREALASLRAAGTPPARAAQVMAHIIAAEVLWHARLNHASAPLAVWPDLSLPQCETWLDNLGRVWPKYLDAVVPGRLAERVGYTNTKGETFSSTVDDILTHVVLHSGYHRGQIASAVRATGHQPAFTDFIHATRTGRIP
jgi:uncharacterized damage-inducible protein DinB